MSGAQRLLCLSPAQPPSFALDGMALPRAGRGEVIVRVEATSVNPIDLKRAGGYGRRLLGLKGAGKFPLVLGNDIAGVIDSVGPGVDGWRRGDRVFGVVPTGRGGAHATHVVTESRWLRRAAAGHGPDALAVYPYTFTTLWQSLAKAGINECNARGTDVLIHGASGALGRMATQLLVHWGARVTAICSTANVPTCRQLGAVAVDRQKQPLAELAEGYDAVLNFGAWEDEAVLIGRLRNDALGYATTVHPLLANFDDRGWLGGAWKTRQDLRRGEALAAAKAARYGWVVFKPDEGALEAMIRFLAEGVLELPAGLVVPLSAATEAFDHVARQRPGRAILLP